MGAVPILVVALLLTVVIVKLLSNMSRTGLTQSKCKGSEFSVITYYCRTEISILRLILESFLPLLVLKVQKTLIFNSCKQILANIISGYTPVLEYWQ